MLISLATWEIGSLFLKTASLFDSYNCQVKSDLCDLHNVATCHAGGSLAQLNAENGEFIA